MKTPILLAALAAAAAPAGAQSAAPKAIGIPSAPRALPEGVIEAQFGAEVPVLGCSVLRACRVELQVGERLLSPPALGDSERWLTVEISTGPGGSVPVVVVKPTECGIATNLMLATDRRIYDLDLEAAPCRGAERTSVRAVRFAYDGETAASYTATAVVEEAAPTLAERAALATRTGYRWTRRGSFPWEPVRIADDGEHVYLELPDVASYSAAPVLYSLDSGERTLLNYSTEGSLFVTDRVFGRAALVIGEASLEIERREPRQGPVLTRVGLAVLSALGGMVAAFLIGG